MSLFPLKYTHSQLVEIGYKWILKGRGCGVAFKELKSLASEIPDVIGFGSGCSIVIECKCSRSDFLGDMKKPHRSKGMGVFRYYLCPQGLIQVDELPAKWGLIWVDAEGQAKVIKNPRKSLIPFDKRVESDNDQNYWTSSYYDAFENDVRAEQRIMYSALRRLFLKGHIDCIYDKDYYNNPKTEP